MRQDIIEKIQIPEGVEVILGDSIIIVKKQNNEVTRKFSEFQIKKEGNELILEKKGSTKNIKKLINTTKAHIINMFSGLDKKFVYKLQVCHVHFPMSVSLDKSKKVLVIKNFLGEAKDRKANIIDGVDVKVDKEIITVEGHDKEKTGQTAANIETATRITNRDRNKFQDGIFITEKPGDKD